MFFEFRGAAINRVTASLTCHETTFTVSPIPIMATRTLSLLSVHAISSSILHATLRR